VKKPLAEQTAHVVRSHFNPDAERATSLQKRIVVMAIGTA
jgi:hypothetical protein